MNAKRSSQSAAHVPLADSVGRPARPTGDDELGRALRMVYDKTLDETIPDAMLDLLKKLG